MSVGLGLGNEKTHLPLEKNDSGKDLYEWHSNREVSVETGSQRKQKLDWVE